MSGKSPLYIAIILFLLSGSVRAGVVCTDWAGEMKVVIEEVASDPAPGLEESESNCCGGSSACSASVDLPANFGMGIIFELSECSEKVNPSHSLNLPDQIPIELLKIPINAKVLA